MSEKSDGSVDLLGIKPIGDAINTATTRSFDGAGAFLSRICLPAAEEFGLLLRDRVSHWRADNAAKIALKAEAKLNAQPNREMRYAPPRLIAQILEHGSWTDTETVQEMWAGLVASSCSSDGKNEGNLLFIDLLSQLTTSEAQILNYLCQKADKYITEAGWIVATELPLEINEVVILTGINDTDRLYRELDHLNSLGLIHGGFNMQHFKLRVEPRSLGLQMFARCQGHMNSMPAFFTSAISVQGSPGRDVDGFTVVG